MAESQQKPAAWLSAARAGSPEALGQGLETFRRYLLQIAQHELDAELQAKGGASDLVQEAFLEAHRDFANFHGSSEAEFRAWLRQLLLHRAAKHGRRYRGVQKRRVAREIALPTANSSSDGSPDLRAEISSPSQQAMAKEQAQALQRALEKLPEDYRQVITLRYQEDRTFEEIGQLMQRSANAVRLLWLRAIERVKQELGHRHES